MPAYKRHGSCCCGGVPTFLCNGCPLPRGDVVLNWSYGPGLGVITGTATSILYYHTTPPPGVLTALWYNFPPGTPSGAYYQEWNDGSLGFPMGNCRFILIGMSCGGVGLSYSSTAAGDPGTSFCRSRDGQGFTTSTMCSDGTTVVQIAQQQPSAPNFSPGFFRGGVVTWTNP